MNVMNASHVGSAHHNDTYIRYIGGYYWVKVPSADKRSVLRLVTRPTNIPTSGDMHLTVWLPSDHRRPRHAGPRNTDRKPAPFTPRHAGAVTR
jgi:hypothetical protein